MTATRSPPSGSRSSARRPASTSSRSRTTPTSPASTRRRRCSDLGRGRTERIQLRPTSSTCRCGSRPSSPGRRESRPASHGRLELGLGAGYFWDAMEAMGVDRLARCLGRRARGGHRHHSRHLGPGRASGLHCGPTASPPPRQRRRPRPGARAQHPDLGGRWQAPDARPHRPDRRRLGHPGGNSGLADLSTAGPHRRRGRDPRRPRPARDQAHRERLGPLRSPRRRLPRRASRSVGRAAAAVVVDDGVGTFILASDDPDTIETFAGEVARPPRGRRAERSRARHRDPGHREQLRPREAPRRHRLRLHPGHLGG